MTVWLPPPLMFDVTDADPGPWTVRATLLESALLKTFWGSPALATLILWPLTTCSSSVKLKGHKDKWILKWTTQWRAEWRKEGREQTSKLRRRASKDWSSMDAMRREWGNAAADPDLQIKGGGGHPGPEIRGRDGVQKKFFRLFGPQFGLKIGGVDPLAPPLDPPLVWMTDRYSIFLFLLTLQREVY